MLLANEIEGNELINQLNGGASFEVLAKAKSLDKSTARQGGVLPSQLVSPVSEVVVNLTKGRVAQKPIQTQAGWDVIKLVDVRPFVMPDYEQVNNNIAQALVQKKRQEALKALILESKISIAK